MVSDTPGCAHGGIKEMVTVADYSLSLPNFMAQDFVKEGVARRSQILGYLRGEQVESQKERSPPNPSDLALGLRCLGAYDEQYHAADIEFRVEICLLLWRLVRRSLTETPLYNYSLLDRIMQQLRHWLNRVAEEHSLPPWSPATTEADEGAFIARLKSELDVRVPLEAMLREMGISFRVDSGASDSKRHHRVHNLAEVCLAMRRFLDPGAGPWLASHLSVRLDGQQRYMMFFARFLVVLTPAVHVEQLLVSGELWKWWSTLPEGLVPKFDLMWFTLLGRHAMLRWANSVSQASDEAVQQRLPWLLNKVCRTFSLPLSSPAAGAAAGERQHTAPEPDRYAIPHELDSAVMGDQSSWKKVAKFLVYRLEASPPSMLGEETAPPRTLLRDPSNIWCWVAFLIRRMSPFLKPANAGGGWMWHCLTFFNSMVQCYFQRVCRERLMPVTTPTARRLTEAADRHFVALMLPLVNDCFQINGSHEQMTALQVITSLARLDAMRPSSDMLFVDSRPDPFGVDMPALIAGAIDALNDPSQSHRHVSLLQFFERSLPAILLRWPTAIDGVLRVTLYAIDPTDCMKTISSLHFLASMLGRVPLLDANDWAGVDTLSETMTSGAIEWRWPVPGDRMPPLCDDEVAGVRCQSSMFSAFVIDFFERVLEYIMRIPKPAKGTGVFSLSAHMEAAALALMHSTLLLACVQTDSSTYNQVLESLSRFLESQLLVDQTKPMKLLVSAVVRADAVTAVPKIVLMIIKRLLPRSSKSGVLQAVPLQEAGVSETEAIWYLNAMSAAVRYGGAALLEHRLELETVIKSALMDDRGPMIPKLGAKLLRRLLSALTATYISDDFRICGAEQWKELRKRTGNASSFKWWGWTKPWWIDSKPSIHWHIASGHEIEWAKELSLGALSRAREILTGHQIDETKANDWLSGFAVSEKKKASHHITLAFLLLRSVVRGTGDLWPDERSNMELREQVLPITAQQDSEMGQVIFSQVTDMLLAVIKELVIMEGGAVDVPSIINTPVTVRFPALDQIEVPKYLAKTLKYLGDLLHYRGKPVTGHLFAVRRGADGGLAAGQLQETPLAGLHSRSRWRDLPRAWWALHVVNVTEARYGERCGGHAFAGSRKIMLEVLCWLSLRSAFMAVRERAQGVLSQAVSNHIGCKWPLLKGIILPTLRAEAESAKKCCELSGDAAVTEQRRLNGVLYGLAFTMGGSIRGFVSSVWRRGLDDAADMGLALCEVIYVVTKVAPVVEVSASSEEKQRCEVKATVTARLISTTHYWLKHREINCLPYAVDEQCCQRTLKIIDNFLALCKRQDCHWRAQVMATSAVLALRCSLMSSPASTAMLHTSSSKNVWLHWAKWLARCCEMKASPALHSLGVHGLLLLFKQPAPLDDSDLMATGVFEHQFFITLLGVIPQLNHPELTNMGGVGFQDHTQGSVVFMTQSRSFRTWPRAWPKHSSSSFALPNVLFWQSYFGLLTRAMPAERFVKALQEGARHLCEQPPAEAEYHVAFCELFAGVLRALRKNSDGAGSLRQHAWSALHQWASSELQKASQDRLKEWCDAIRYIVQGTSSTLLKLSLFLPDGADALPDRREPDAAFLTPLINFAASSGTLPNQDLLSCKLPPVQHIPVANLGDDAVATREASSFDSIKQLRIFMALLLEPASVECIGLDTVFCMALFDALKPGLGHPYKQLREEVARSLFLIVNAAGDRTGGAGLATVADHIETWLTDKAESLLVKLRDSADIVTEAEASRPQHILESSGVCFVLIHTALSRLVVDRFHELAPRCLEFLLVATTSNDHELRGLATHTLVLCCGSQPAAPGIVNVSKQELQIALMMRTAIGLFRRTDGSTLNDKELEKAFKLAVQPLIFANMFMLCGQLQNDAPANLDELWTIIEEHVGHSKHEVRHAASGALAALLGLEGKGAWKENVNKFVALAGPPMKRGGPSLDANKNRSVAGVMGLSCILLSVADVGVTPWTGHVVERMAPYGKPGTVEFILKEVQGTFQTFMRLQQANQQSWKECQEKLTPAQLELLSACKGSLSYYS